VRLGGWKAGKKKLDNVYKYFKSTGCLITVFPARNGYSFVSDGEFHGPFPTQMDAQIEAEKFAAAVGELAAETFEIPETILADSQDEKESSMTEAIAQAGQATQAPQYATRAAFDKLVGYTNQLVVEHNQLEKRVEALEAATKDLIDVLMGNGVEHGTFKR
jgi:excinuclease UvrABC nuclease subunit